MSLLTAAPPRLYPHHSQERTESTPRPIPAAISYWHDLFNSQRLSPPEYKYLFPNLSNMENESVKELLSYKLTHEMNLCNDTNWAGLNAVGLTAFWLKVLSEPRIPQLRACKLLFVSKLVELLAGTELFTDSLLSGGDRQFNNSPMMPFIVTTHPPTSPFGCTSSTEHADSPSANNQMSSGVAADVESFTAVSPRPPSADQTLAPHPPSHIDPGQGEGRTSPSTDQSLRKEKITPLAGAVPTSNTLDDMQPESCLPSIKEEATLIPNDQFMDYPMLNGHKPSFSLSTMHDPAGETLGKHHVGNSALGKRHHAEPALGERHHAKLALGEQHQPQLALGEQHQPQLALGEQHRPQLALGEQLQPQLALGEQHRPQLALGEQHRLQQALGEQHQPQLALGEQHRFQQALGEQHQLQQALGEQHQPRLALGEYIAGDETRAGQPANRLLPGEITVPDSLLYQEDGKPLPMSIDGQQVDESDLWTEVEDGPTTSFSCNTCHYVSTYKSRIKQHIRSMHSSIKPYKCDYCDHTTAIRASLTKHVNAVHRRSRPFSCSMCDYQCSLKKSLEEHMASVHHKQFKHRCPYCEYAAPAKNVVDTHVQAVHMKERPYKCPHCDYRSAYPQYIPKHIAAVHDRQKPYACPHCPYRSSYKTYLQKHCDAVHNNIKPFSCPHCPYVTSYSQYLNKHISAVHNDEKPHKCPFCQFRCAYKQYINKHIELVHPGLTNPNRPAPHPSAQSAEAKGGTPPGDLKPTTPTLTSQTLPTQFLSHGFGPNAFSTPDRMFGNPLANMTFSPALPGHLDMFRFGGFTPPLANRLPQEQPSAPSLSHDMFTRVQPVCQRNSGPEEAMSLDDAASTDQPPADVSSSLTEMPSSSVPSSSALTGNMYVWPGMTG